MDSWCESLEITTGKMVIKMTMEELAREAFGPDFDPNEHMITPDSPDEDFADWLESQEAEDNEDDIGIIDYDETGRPKYQPGSQAAFIEDYCNEVRDSVEIKGFFRKIKYGIVKFLNKVFKFLNRKFDSDRINWLSRFFAAWQKAIEDNQIIETDGTIPITEEVCESLGWPKEYAHQRRYTLMDDIIDNVKRGYKILKAWFNEKVEEFKEWNSKPLTPESFFDNSVTL